MYISDQPIKKKGKKFPNNAIKNIYIYVLNENINLFPFNIKYINNIVAAIVNLSEATETGLIDCTEILIAINAEPQIALNTINLKIQPKLKNISENNTKEICENIKTLIKSVPIKIYTNNRLDYILEINKMEEHYVQDNIIQLDNSEAISVLSS